MLQNSRRAHTMGTTREIVAKALKDEAFRARLLKDAKAAIKKDFGLEFPEGVKIQVHEDTPTVLNLVLPAPLNVSTDRALSDEELAQVSGGVLLRSGANTFGAYTSCCSRPRIGTP